MYYVWFALLYQLDNLPERDVLSDEFKQQIKKLRKVIAPSRVEEVTEVGNNICTMFHEFVKLNLSISCFN